MRSSQDHVINVVYGLPSIFTERRIAKDWWEPIEDIKKKDIINEYIKLWPSKEHLKFHVQDGDLYHIYLFYTYKYV